MKNFKKNVKGITLISLVITIIVLIILAGISINLVLGENGLLTQAQKAKDKTDEAVKNEISSLGELEDILHETETGIVVEKVEDANPGELEQSETDTYTINSIEDLVAFAHNVTTGTDNYEGKTVKLGLSLDFASTKSYVNANRTDYEKYGYNGELKKLLNENGFIPIGTQESLEISERSFHGTFDGDGNTIYNLKIRSEFLSTGMFVKNYGIIQDLGVENANIYINIIKDDKWHQVGILASHIPSGGEINKCHVSGKIVGTAESCEVGGIVGNLNNGKIYNSYSKVDIEISSNESVSVGLIVGGISSAYGEVKNVYSKGTIYPSGKVYVGLSVGASSGKIENSYTIGNININVDKVKQVEIRTFGQKEKLR